MTKPCKPARLHVSRLASVWPRAAFAMFVPVSLLVACDGNVPECARGEIRYKGRPPQRLFSFDTSCRADCFSFPAAGGCEQSCDDVATSDVGGALVGDRFVTLMDAGSIGGGRALALRFGFLDEAGGTAPDAWGLTAQGPRTYLADELQATARFVAEASVLEVDGDLTQGTVLTGPIASKPGRLELLEATATRLVGRFFLAFETPTEQPQGELVGCFDVGLDDAVDVDGTPVQAITR